MAAVDENLDLATFSQRNRYVDLAAPGVDVLSTFPMSGCQICDSLGVKKYGVISGTSMGKWTICGREGQSISEYLCRRLTDFS